MEKIKFTFEETNEDVVFAVLASLNHNDTSYILVVDENDVEEEDMTAYILKVVSVEEEDVIYEIVDDDSELEEVSSKFDDVLENFEIDE